MERIASNIIIFLANIGSKLSNTERKYELYSDSFIFDAEMLI